MTTKQTSILFMTADPSNASRLRLGQELRDIQTRLQLAGAATGFLLQHRASIRPADLTQAIFDTRPEIIHFSGHGAPSGELLLEDDAGRAHPVTPQALEALFALCGKEVRCVLLNACYSEAQALAISKHIDYVIGMRRAIGDAAAIAFAVGFYKALSAGRTIRESFEFGVVELRLHNIPEHNTPVLLEGSSPAQFFLAGRYVRKFEHGTSIHFPSGYPRHAQFICDHPAQEGCLLVDPDAYDSIGHLLDDVYTKHLQHVVSPFSYGTEWLLMLDCMEHGPIVAPWEWVLTPEHHEAGIPRWQRERAPCSFGLSRKVSGEIVFVGRIPRFADCTVVASNNALVCDILRKGLKPRLFLMHHLNEVSASAFNADDYRYTLVLPPMGPFRRGRVLVHLGTELPEAFGPEMLSYLLDRET